MNKCKFSKNQTIVLVILNCLISFDLYAQQISHKRVIDLTLLDTIKISPFHYQDKNTRINYSKIIADSSVLQQSSGISILNSLRGQVPGLMLSPYIRNYPANFRGRNLEMIVDGAPFNSLIMNYYNFNSFDFSDITFLSNRTTHSFIDSQNSGAIVLSSKSGSGYTKPTIEFNSYGTYAWWKGIGIGSVITSKPLEDYLLSNSIAFMNDFGLIDLRVSYNNHATLIDPEKRLIRSPLLHNIKLNIGAEVKDKFVIRFILNSQLNKYKSDYLIESDLFPDDTISDKGHQKFLYGNLIAKYKVFDWLSLTSQVTISRGVSSSSFTQIEAIASNSQRLIRESDKNERRATENIFFDAHKLIGKKIILKNFTGLQFIQQQADKFWSVRNTFGEIFDKPKRSVNSSSIVTGLTLQDIDLWNVNVSYRNTIYSDDFESSKNRTSNYSFGSSFIFSDLIKSKIFSFGRIRANFCSTIAQPIMRFSWLDLDLNNVSVNETNKSFEAGADVLSANSKIGISFNYFKDKFNNKNWDNYINEGDVMAISFLTEDQWSNKGWEADIKLDLFKNEIVNYHLGFLFSSQRFRGENDLNFSNRVISYSVNNQFIFKSFTLSLLVDALDRNSRIESSFIKLRDLSIYYKIPISGLILEEAYFSMSGRNLYVFDISGIDEEQNPQKSISLSLTMVF